MFSPSGDKLQSFGTEGASQGQFMNPRGVAVDGEGNNFILVVDSYNHRIKKLTAKGQFLELRAVDPSSLMKCGTLQSTPGVCCG